MLNHWRIVTGLVPLTLVLPVEDEQYAGLNPGMNMLGLRIPACTATRELLRATGPLATTSANRSGGASQSERNGSLHGFSVFASSGAASLVPLLQVKPAQ